jgi:preprotein translocase subunit SecG
MKPTTVAAEATSNRWNRIRIVLAAAWLILSLALGGVVNAEAREAGATVSNATQP